MDGKRDSNSRGIDLVVRKFSKQWNLTLFEGKHLHSAVKGKSKDRCYPEIRSRFRDGLTELETRILPSISRIYLQRLVSESGRLEPWGWKTQTWSTGVTFYIGLRNEGYLFGGGNLHRFKRRVNQLAGEKYGKRLERASGHRSS